MNSSTTGELRNPNSLRAKYALRVAITLAAIFIGSIGLYFYLAQSINAWQLSVFAQVNGFAFILNILTIRYALQKRVETAIYLIIGEIILLILVTTSLLSGVGLVLGISVLLGVYVIATLTLVQPQLSRAFVVGIIAGVAIIMLDAFFPFERLEIRLLTIYIPIITVINNGIFLYAISQQFSNYPFRTKLAMAFVAIAIITVSSIGYFINRSSSIRLTQDVGYLISLQGKAYALIIGENLSKEVTGIEAFGLSEVVQDRVDVANAAYSGSPAAILDQIQVLDKQWRAADKAQNDNDPLVSKVLQDHISAELQEYKTTFPDNVEVFVTDKYGANVAATNRTSDYYQADEEWWQAAYNDGNGAIYIGTPEYDTSSSTYASVIAVPLYAHETKQVIGVLRTTLDIRAITQILSSYQLGQTGKIEFYLADGKTITGIGGDPISGDPIVANLSTADGSYLQSDYFNIPSLISRSRLTALDPQMAGVIEKLGWSVVIHQDRTESLAPVNAQTQTIILISLVLLILTGGLALIISQVLTQPVQALTNVAEQVASGNLNARSKISTQDEIGALANSFNRMTSQLQDTLAGLERRIAERTADAELARLISERRAQELQAISEVSRTVSTEQKLEILLPLVTRLVSERFDFYHVGIFFVDATKQFAVLQASNSEGGKRMLARGHRLEVGLTGIVGAVSQTGKPRIALDVGADATFFNNPDLPETRSEMALPLNFRGATIGVLDVQSVKPGAFTESDANTLSILADQVAIAIENARLFGQTQQARDEAEALYNQFQRTEWKNFSQEETTIGYSQSTIGGKPIVKLVDSAEIREALQKGQVVVFDGKNLKAQPSISLPIKLRGQTIGVLNIKAPTKNRKWNEDEINLAQAVSDRLALALDNARLLQESQRRASKEAKIGEVTAKIGASINMRNVLQTAVEELGRALPGSEIILQFEQVNNKDPHEE